MSSKNGHADELPPLPPLPPEPSAENPPPSTVSTVEAVAAVAEDTPEPTSSKELNDADFEDDLDAANSRRVELGLEPLAPPRRRRSKPARAVAEAEPDLDDTDTETETPPARAGVPDAAGGTWRFQTRSLPTQGNVAPLDTVNAIELRISPDGDVSVNIPLAGWVPCSALEQVATRFRRPVIKAVLNAIPNKDADLRAYDDATRAVKEAKEEAQALDLEVEEVQARRRRLALPGNVRGAGEQLQECDRQLATLTNRRRAAEVEIGELKRHEAAAHTTLRKRVARIVEEAQQRQRGNLRADLVAQQKQILELLAPKLFDLCASFRTWYRSDKAEVDPGVALDELLQRVERQTRPQPQEQAKEPATAGV